MASWTRRPPPLKLPFARIIGHAIFPPVRLYIFTSGLTILATGVAAMYLLPRPQSVEFLEGALKLGGGIVICGFFSIRMKWHGLIGAGIMALLGSARGLSNVPGFLKFMTGDRSRQTAPVLEFGVTLICLLLLVKVIRALYQERLRQMLEAEE